jgi:protein involved in polysaccharide export with SLBB domain
MKDEENGSAFSLPPSDWGDVMHRSSDGTFFVTRPACSCGTALAWAVFLVVCSLAGGCAALTNPVADGVSVRHVPLELLEPTKEGEQTIPLTMLGQPRPATYRLEPGDVLGVYIEGFLGERDQAAPLPIHVGPLAQVRDQHRLAPSAGYPVPVEDDGTIHLPAAGSLPVRGMSIAEAREAIRSFGIQKHLFKQENARVIVTLLSPRQVQVLVLRQEAASFTSASEGPILSSKRGTGHFIDLPAYENDVLHALTLTGGLPGLDARNEIVIQRNCFQGECDRKLLLQQLEASPGGEIPCAGRSIIRIPLRQPPNTPVPFRPEDVILQTGDVVFLEDRDDELFYTGGLLPSGVFVLPRDHDLDVVEAVSRVRGPLFNGAFGGSNLAGNLIAPGIGGPSPTLLVVLRRTPGGGQVPIVVDLGNAMQHPEERLLVRAGDVLILQEKPGEALARYFTQTFFNFNLGWQVVHDKFATGIIDVATPDRLPQRLNNVTINPR